MLKIKTVEANTICEDGEALPHNTLLHDGMHICMDSRKSSCKYIKIIKIVDMNKEVYVCSYFWQNKPESFPFSDKL